jgi:hypothetical protein
MGQPSEKDLGGLFCHKSSKKTSEVFFVRLIVLRKGAEKTSEVFFAFQYSGHGAPERRRVRGQDCVHPGSLARRSHYD